MQNHTSLSGFALSTVLIFAVTLLTGCSSSTEPEPPGPGDTTAPTVSSVTAPDASHFEVLFSESVDRASAESRSNYEILRQGGVPILAVSPGDTLSVESAALLADGRTVLLSVYPNMSGMETYDVKVQNVKDLSGNSMEGTSSTSVAGVDTPDTTAPTITGQSPAPGATGVGVGQTVAVTFSEPMESGSVLSAFSWTGPGGNVAFDMDEMDGNVFIFQPDMPMARGEQYTVGFAANTATDRNSNFLAATSWSFTTTNAPDNTVPTLLATTPADGATNVSLDAVLRLEFSEPMDPFSGTEDGIFINPDVGDGTITWTNGGTTLNFEPFSPLLANTTYHLGVIEGAVRDLAGNPLAGNYSVSFTTGSTLPSGAISGTISGDPRSAQAADPQGTLAVVFLANILTWNWDESDPPIGGFDEVVSNGAYSIPYLIDATYWTLGLLDADSDGEISFDYGDAIGIYGVDFQNLMGEPQPDSVIIVGGIPAAGVDFTLFDLASIRGEVSYGGTAYANDLTPFNFYIGVFDTAGFNPGNPMPVIGTEAQSIVWDSHYGVNQLNDGLQDGTYYLGAFMDVDLGDGEGYNPSVDPIGFHEMGGQLTAVTVENGADAKDIDIVLQDPPGGPPRGRGLGAWSVSQSSAPRDATLAGLWKAIEYVNRVLKEQAQ
jgi:hypothetical protein